MALPRPLKVPEGSPGHASSSGWLSRVHARCDGAGSYLEHIAARALAVVFSTLGSVNGRFPRLVVTLAAIVLLGFSAAFLALKDERLVTDVDELWAPARSRARTDEAEVRAAYGDFDRVAAVIVSASPTVLSDLTLVPLAAFEARVDALTVAVNGATYGFKQLCARAFDDVDAPCLRASVTDFFNGTVAGVQRAAAVNEMAKRASVRGARTSVGLPVIRENVLGAVRVATAAEFAGTDAVLSAGAAMSVWKLTADVAMRPAVEAWERAFLLEAEAYAVDARGETADVSYSTESSAALEIMRSGDSALPLAAVGAFLIFCLMYVTTRSSDRYEARTWLAPIGLFVILASCTAGLGAALMFGAKYTSITVVVLFLVFGVGVDDIVLLFGADHDVPAALASSVRIVQTMKAAGPMVSVTTFTTVLAFLAGIPSAFPAVSSFCLGAALVMLANYVSVCTLFSSCMVLDDERRRDFRLDWMCCFHADVSKKEIARRRLRSELTSHVRFVKTATDLASLVLKQNWYRAFVLVWFFVALPAGSVFYCTHMKTGLKTSLVLPDDSYLTEFIDSQETSFAHMGADLGLFLWGSEGKGGGIHVDFESPAVRSEIESLTAALEAIPSVGGTTQSLFRAFDTHLLRLANVSAASTAAAADVLAANPTNASLHDFVMANPLGAPYRGDVITSGGRIQTARVNMRHVVMSESDDRTTAMRDTRRVLDNFIHKGTTSHVGRATVYSPSYVLWESYAIQMNELVVSLVTSFVVVLGTLVFFMHAQVALIIALQVVLIDAAVLGWMVMMGLKLHSVTTVTLIMAVGVAVDFGAHTGHGWLSAKGSRLERSIQTTAELGLGLTIGAFSTFLGVLPLAFAIVESTRIFFTMMAGVLIIGWGYGVIALPVVLSFIGPDGEGQGSGDEGILEEEEEEEDAPASPFSFLRGSIRPKQRPPRVIEVMPKYPRSLEEDDPVHNIENLAFEGGGQKGICYLGALLALDEAGVLKHVKRVVGTSAGALTALGVALGLGPEQIREYVVDLDIFNDFLVDNRATHRGMFSAALSINARLGMNEGKRFVELLRWIIKRHTGNPDITFAQLLQHTGRELCICVTNLSQGQGDFCHVKTTPHMPVHVAVKASMSIPFLINPVEYDGIKYVDGGVTNNYPVDAFDGWWLSLKPEDSFLFRMGQAKGENALQKLMAGKFGSADECNLKTVGFKTWANDDLADPSIAWMPPGGEPPPPPDSRLARERRAETLDNVNKQEHRHRVLRAFKELLTVAQEQDADGNLQIDRREWDAVLANMSQKSIEILFEGETNPGVIFRKLDVDGSKSLDFSEIAKSIEGTGLNISSLISGLEPSDVNGVGDYFKTVIGILSTQIEVMKVKSEDHLRTVPLCAGHIGIADLDLEEVDKQWAIKSGYVTTKAFLFKRRRSSVHGILTRLVRRLRGSESNSAMGRALERGRVRYETEQASLQSELNDPLFRKIVLAAEYLGLAPFSDGPKKTVQAISSTGTTPRSPLMLRSSSSSQSLHSQSSSDPTVEGWSTLLEPPGARVMGHEFAKEVVKAFRGSETELKPSKEARSTVRKVFSMLITSASSPKENGFDAV